MANLLINFMLYNYHIFEKNKVFYNFQKHQFNKSVKYRTIHNNY